MWLGLKGMKYKTGTQAGKVNWHQIRADCKCQAMLGLYPAGNREPSKVLACKGACSNLCSRMSLSAMRRREERMGVCSLELGEIATVAIVSGTGENKLKWVRRDRVKRRKDQCSSCSREGTLQL